jgi:hypothetical protein
VENKFSEPSIMFGDGPVQQIEGAFVLAQSYIDDGEDRWRDVLAT